MTEDERAIRDLVETWMAASQVVFSQIAAMAVTAAAGCRDAIMEMRNRR